MTPNKLLVALVASVFALGSVAAMGDDQTPAQPVDPAKLKAEKDAAKAAAAKMTPEEKAAARKAKRAKRQQEASAIAKEADKNLEDAATTPSGRRPDYDRLHRRYLEPLPPERWPVKREPATSNP
jgi:hypothetical protein